MMTNDLDQEASYFLYLYFSEHHDVLRYGQRLLDIQDEIDQHQIYCHTHEELVYGARLAWRNSTRCIGRLHWDQLEVYDRRHVLSADDIFESLKEHIVRATNKGKIRSMVSIFAPQLPNQPGIRIWNTQLIRYAGYKEADGSILGDPMHVRFTELAMQLGWKPPVKRTAFDLLPIIIQMPFQYPKLYELPPNIVLEVPISHPDYPWFEELQLKWHALPVVSNMRLEIGGLRYTAAPFNGWYMGTEIGARNFADEQRYNLLPVIADKLKLNKRNTRTLWKDQALVVLNQAVLSSFAHAKVTIVDHHIASQQFMLHIKREHACGRDVYGDWAWLVPPISASATPLFHCSMENVQETPNYFPQASFWLDESYRIPEHQCM